MIINGESLLKKNIIEGMLSESRVANGSRYGLSEIGYDIRCAERIEFDPKKHNGRFRLASSMEYFHMPTDCCGFVCDRSTHARSSVGVYNTTINPGWIGYLTIELGYLKDDPIVIEAGTPIAQIIIATLSDEVEYDGKYQYQEAGPQNARRTIDASTRRNGCSTADEIIKRFGLLARLGIKQPVG